MHFVGINDEQNLLMLICLPEGNYISQRGALFKILYVFFKELNNNCAVEF